MSLVMTILMKLNHVSATGSLGSWGPGRRLLSTTGFTFQMLLLPPSPLQVEIVEQVIVGIVRRVDGVWIVGAKSVLIFFRNRFRVRIILQIFLLLMRCRPNLVFAGILTGFIWVFDLLKQLTSNKFIKHEYSAISSLKLYIEITNVIKIFEKTALKIIFQSINLKQEVGKNYVTSLLKSSQVCKSAWRGADRHRLGRFVGIRKECCDFRHCSRCCSDIPNDREIRKFRNRRKKSH